MKVKNCLILTAFLATVFVFSPKMFAQSTADVTATVTAQNISVTLTTDGSVAFGTIATTSTEDTTLSGVDDTETAQNNGNVIEDFNIQGFDSTSSGSGWALDTSAGTDAYTMKFCISDCDGTASWSDVGDGSYTSLATGIAASGTQDVDLQVGTPTSTNDYNEQTMTVTIQAVAN